MSTYQIGSVVRLSGAYTDLSNAPADPSVVLLSIQHPDGTIKSFTYGSSAIVNDSVGNYHYDYTPAVNGNFVYRWYSTGLIQASASSSFSIKSWA